jgi:hypothetical protein
MLNWSRFARSSTDYHSAAGTPCVATGQQCPRTTNELNLHQAAAGPCTDVLSKHLQVHMRVNGEGLLLPKLMSRRTPRCIRVSPLSGLKHIGRGRLAELEVRLTVRVCSCRVMR